MLLKLKLMLNLEVIAAQRNVAMAEAYVQALDTPPGEAHACR